MLSLLAADLKDASSDNMTEHLLDRKPHRARINLEHLLKPLAIISGNLPANACAG